MARQVFFVSEATAFAIHQDQINAFGGTLGLRDEHLFLSALGQAEQTYAYTGDLFEAAAAYGVSLAKNHPFVDGNKRTAAAVMLTFPVQNSVRLDASPAQIVDWMVRIAIGELDRDALAALLREHSKSSP